ncbi:hypothetical protein GDO81_001686 [Engystomops pustulosus]|uniref:Peptidase M1 leukotriene A4 hydrolase/aminopeptidase C-terminal domain-containing protein n=1 Tax=Engystomops pustulosus TaxID=76066 RepID=A0AAV7DH93_ENGPU|nr:hypothetical protein GDO81_001686 [Engystomops pustulosus]
MTLFLEGRTLTIGLQTETPSVKRKWSIILVSAVTIVPDQLILLLDLLLEEKKICGKTLQCLKKTYNLQEQDAEVRHRWCELVIKHKYTTSYNDVEAFLLQDQAMGVYLYGELMVNEDARQQELAHRCFAAVRDQMDVSCVKVVGEMLF